MDVAADLDGGTVVTAPDSDFGDFASNVVSRTLRSTSAFSLTSNWTKVSCKGAGDAATTAGACLCGCALAGCAISVVAGSIALQSTFAALCTAAYLKYPLNNAIKELIVVSLAGTGAGVGAELAAQLGLLASSFAIFAMFRNDWVKVQVALVIAFMHIFMGMLHKSIAGGIGALVYGGDFQEGCISGAVAGCGECIACSVTPPEEDSNNEEISCCTILVARGAKCGFGALAAKAVHQDPAAGAVLGLFDQGEYAPIIRKWKT